MPTNLAKGLLAAKPIAQEIMSAIGTITADAEPFHVSVPKDGPRFETINGSLGDLALHPGPQIGHEFELLVPKLKAI
jgi:hypothetical protein